MSNNPNRSAENVGLASAVKYNPHLWGDEELKSVFVARNRELGGILDALLALAPDTVPQHVLITGPRGMGKTTLLQRVGVAVEENERLRDMWVPLRFPEEQYTVSTPAELWTNVIGALADAQERSGVPAVSIDQQLDFLPSLPQAEREDAALAWISTWCATNGKRLLLLVDSTDLLFTNLASADRNAGGATSLWRVRKVLTHSSHLFWLGGSYQPLESTGLYSDAFLDFFHLIELRPLSLDEVKTAILALARTFGAGRGLRGADAEGVISRALVEHPSRLPAMLKLTGGNPRTTVMLYELFAAGGEDSLRSDLERLLDNATPLYKSRLESLADQPRKVMAHVLENWAPVSARKLAENAGLPVSTVSAQLSRLEQEGLVEKAAGRSGKRATYQVAERLFNVWYLMRSAQRGLRLRLGWLVEFMRLWYSADELQQLASKRWLEHRRGLRCDNTELEYSRAIVRALPKEVESRRHLDWTLFKLSRGRAELSELFDLGGDDSVYTDHQGYATRMEGLRSAVDAQSTPDATGLSDLLRAAVNSLTLSLSAKEALAKEATAFTQREREERLVALEATRLRLAKRFGRPAVEALERSIHCGDFCPECIDLPLGYAQIHDAFGDDQPAQLLGLFLLGFHGNAELREALIAKLGSPEENSALGCLILGMLLRTNPDHQERASEALSRAVELSPDSSGAWSELADFLFSRRLFQEAENAYVNAVRLDTRDQDVWRDYAFLLLSQQRFSDAEDALSKAIESGRSLPRILGLHAAVLHRLGRNAEAEAAYRLAIERGPTDSRPWVGLGILLASLGLERFEEAEAAYRTATTVEPQHETTWSALADFLRFQRKDLTSAAMAYRRATEVAPNDARVWMALGDFLNYELPSPTEAEEAYRKAIKCAPEDSGPWTDLGYLYQFRTSDFEKADEAYRKALDLNPNSVRALHDYSVLLEREERLDDAEARISKAIGIQPADSSLWLQLGDVLTGSERIGEAEAAYRKALELSPEEPEAWFGLGHLLHAHTNRYEESRDAYQRALEISPGIAEAWGELAQLLQYQFRALDQAEESFRKGLEIEATDDELWRGLAKLLVDRGRIDEAYVAYERALVQAPDNADAWSELGDILQDHRKDFGGASRAYTKAIESEPDNPYPRMNAARLAASLGEKEKASGLFREALPLAQEADAPALVVQAGLWLANMDVARIAMESLAREAASGDGVRFADLRDLCRECVRIGLATPLANLLDDSEFASFLMPLSLALRMAQGQRESFEGIPAEVLAMAEEVSKEWVV